MPNCGHDVIYRTTMNYSDLLGKESDKRPETEAQSKKSSEMQTAKLNVIEEAQSDLKLELTFQSLSDSFFKCQGRLNSSYPQTFGNRSRHSI